MTTDPVIRPLSLPETEMLVDWARAEGWNPGLADAAAFHAADPNGLIGCFVEDKMAAGISAVRYGEDFGFIGLYIARSDFRGKGYGHRVWNAGMAHLQGRTIGLDGVAERQTNYRQMGFEAVYETFRWSGRVEGGLSEGVVSITAGLEPVVCDYDRHFFPSERSAFLTEWLQPPRFAKAILGGSGLRGYAVCRQCHDGYKIGPLFGETAEDAISPLRACAIETGAQTMHIDLPASQTSFAAELASHGFTRGFTTTRMYRGPVREIRMAGIFGITTLELG